MTPGWVAIANQGQVEAGFKPPMSRGLDWPCASRLGGDRLMAYIKGRGDTSKGFERTAATCLYNYYCTFQENYMMFKYNK